MAVVLASCGGGVGEAVIAVASFLGAGGGQYTLEVRPAVAGFSFGDDAITLSLASNAVVTTQPTDLYASGYDVYVLNVTGTRLASCRNASGRAEGRRLMIGTNGSCFAGNFDSVNRAVSDDGTKALYIDFFPNLSTGLWVDVNDASHSFKFIGVASGCEFSGSTTRRIATVVLRPATIQQAAVGQAVTFTATGIASLAVTGGNNWTGEFIGVSAMRLTSGGTTVELQRRNVAAPAAC